MGASASTIEPRWVPSTLDRWMQPIARKHQRMGRTASGCYLSSILLTTRTGRDATNPIVLHPLVPPNVQRHLRLARCPREPLDEAQIRRVFLQASELDFEFARRA